MRHPTPICEWEDCGRPPVGFRIFWRASTMFATWLCRPHQRWWDRGVRHRRHQRAEGELDG